MSEINLRPIVSQAYAEIVSTPYYQDGDIYRYAKHLIIDSDNTSLAEIKAIIDESEELEADSEIVESYQAMLDAISQLEKVTIPKTDYEGWVLQRIKSDAMMTYAEILDDLFATLTLIAYSHGPWQATDHSYTVDDWIDSVYVNNERVMVIDYRQRKEDDDTNISTQEYVLNRKNPFADVSIKNQRFIYASDYNRFNALELRTSRKITKMDKDEERSYVVLQPGFNIHNSPKIEEGAKSNIRFDDTLTTEITQDDDKTYIYLDVVSISSD